MTIAYILITYFIIFAVLEFFKKKNYLGTENTRSLNHLSSGVFSVFLPFWISREEIIIISIAFFLFLLVSKKINLLKSIHQVNRKTFGEILFPVSVGVAAYFFLPSNIEYYVLAILILSMADPSANYVGRKLKGKKTLTDKTFFGSIVFFTVCLSISLFYLDPVSAILLSIFIAIVEGLSPFGWDNLTIVLSVLLYFQLF